LTSSLSTLAELLGRLVATDTSTPYTTLLFILVGEVCLGGGDEGSQLALVLRLDVLEGNDSGGLLVNDRAETSLALDDDVGNTHLAAKGRKENDKLNGIDIMSDDNKGSLLGLDEGNAVVETVLDEEGLLGVLGLGLLLLSSSLGEGINTGLLLLLGLWAVLVQELEQLSSGVLVQGVRELGNGGGHLEALVKDDLLALKANIFGPLDEAGQVSLVLNVLTDTEVLGVRLEERVLLDLARGLRAEGGGSGLLAGGFGGFGLVIETNTSAIERHNMCCHRLCIRSSNARTRCTAEDNNEMRAQQ